MKKKNYYAEISGWIDDLERGHLSYFQIPMITDKITWCWKFRKISPEQKDALCNRMIAYFDGNY